MAFDLAQLDEFPGGLARVLFATHPEWVGYARIEIADDGETPDLVVEVPSPHSEEGAKLVVYTEDFEVTVNFAYYHNHFDWPANDVDISLKPISLIAAILNEDVAAASGWNDEKWAGSWLVKRGEQIEPPEKFSSMKIVRVRFWDGTLNQDVPAT